MNAKLSEAERQRAFKFCTDILDGGWSNLALADLQVTKLSGGMSNLLYHCALPVWVKTHGNEPREVLLRLYGPSHGDTQVQLEIYNLLANESLGPKLFGAFCEGRLEEYLPSNPLSWVELTNNNVSATIARKLAAIHRLDVTCLDKKSNWLLDNYHQLNDFILTTSAESLKTDPQIKESTREIAIQFLGKDFKSEIEFLAELIQKSNSQLVFSHNDLHQNNIILLTAKTDNDNKQRESSNPDADNHDDGLQDRIVLIDFEYCSYNYRPFDLANHLMERCFDYSGDEYPYFSASFEWFPSMADQKRFIAHYINETNSMDHQAANKIHCDTINSHLKSNGHSRDSLIPGGAVVDGDSSQHEGSDDIERFYREMQPFMMASNFLWALWAIKSACTSEIAFGYWVSTR